MTQHRLPAERVASTLHREIQESLGRNSLQYHPYHCPSQFVRKVFQCIISVFDMLKSVLAELRDCSQESGYSLVNYIVLICTTLQTWFRGCIPLSTTAHGACRAGSVAVVLGDLPSQALRHSCLPGQPVQTQKHMGPPADDHRFWNRC